MENIIHKKVLELSSNDIKIKSQATPEYIKKNWNFIVPVDKSSRKFDEVIFDKKNKKLWIIETNYYGSGGSKLKSVCGEFTTLNNLISTNENISFIWITDGIGWKSSEIPLSEAFSNIKYIFNLDMVLEKNFLKDLIEHN